MISKQYDIGVRLVAKFSNGHTEYGQLYDNENLSSPIFTLVNDNWDKNLSNGTDGNKLIKDGTVISLESFGEVQEFSSYTVIDGNEVYSTPQETNTSDTAFLYKRVNNQSHIHAKLNITNNDTSLIDSNLLSVKNMMGSKTLDTNFSSINSYLDSLVASDMIENHDVAYFDNARFCITTKFFPILPNVKIYGQTSPGVWISLDADIEKVHTLTGEILISRVGLDKVKIFYFMMPIATKKSEVIPYIDDDKNYMSISSLSGKVFMDIDYSGNNLYIDTVNQSKIELSCKNEHTSISSSKQIVVNGKVSNKFRNDSIYTISPSTSLINNIYQSNLSGDTATVSNYADSIDIVLFGKFTNGNVSRYAPLSIGTDSIAAPYAALCTTDVSLYQTLLHSTVGPLPAIANGQISYNIDIDFATDGYIIPMPSAIDKNSIAVTVDDGTGPVVYTDYEIINPNILVFNKRLIKKDNTYNVQYTSIISPILSIVDTISKEVHLEISSDLFAHYTDLEGLHILSKDNCEVSFSNNFNLNSELVFANKFKFTITPTKKYIYASLSKYQALLFGTI